MIQFSQNTEDDITDLLSIISIFRAYIANRVTDKLTPVTERVFCCRSGSAAATQAIADYAKYQLNILRWVSSHSAPELKYFLSFK